MNARGAPQLEEDRRYIARSAETSPAPIVADFWHSKNAVARGRKFASPSHEMTGNDVGSSIAERRQTNGTPFETGVTAIHRTAVLRAPQDQKPHVDERGWMVVSARRNSPSSRIARACGQVISIPLPDFGEAGHVANVVHFQLARRDVGAGDVLVGRELQAESAGFPRRFDRWSPDKNRSSCDLSLRKLQNR